jgi:antitoxin (DNA-binding transcriptional repressor) of toxin-antitoxin stability system
MISSRSVNHNARSNVDLVAVVRGMRRHRGWLHYVGLATSRTIKHAQLVLSKYKFRVSTVTADTGPLAPPLQSGGPPAEPAALEQSGGGIGGGGGHFAEASLAASCGPLVATEDAAHAAVLQRLADQASADARATMGEATTVVALGDSSGGGGGGGGGDNSAVEAAAVAMVAERGRPCLKLVPLVQWYPPHQHQKKIKKMFHNVGVVRALTNLNLSKGTTRPMSPRRTTIAGSCSADVPNEWRGEGSSKTSLGRSRYVAGG